MCLVYIGVCVCARARVCVCVCVCDSVQAINMAQENNMIKNIQTTFTRNYKSVNFYRRQHMSPKKNKNNDKIAF